MRFYARFSLSKNIKLIEPFSKPDWVPKVLQHHRFFVSENYSIDCFMYEISKPSIVEQNWENPIFETDSYLLFVAGSVYFRLAERDVPGDYVPRPKEIFDMVIKNKENIHTRLKGNFYLVLYHKDSCSVEIYSAPLAVNPAWYTIKDGVLHVSNIVESLIQTRGGLDFDPRGLYEFSLFDHCLKDRTIYKEIFMLEGGKKLQIDHQSVIKRDSYDINKWFTNNPAKRSESLDKIDYALKRHIGEFTRSSEQYNTSLTGGYDSRLNLAYIPEKDYSRMQTLSYGKAGSNQLKIPYLIASKLGFAHNGVVLGDDFQSNYANLGMQSILYSGGVSPFIRAMYPYAYGKVASFSRSCMLGQCDMIRPLSISQPAGAIYNDFSFNVFFSHGEEEFKKIASDLISTGYINPELLSGVNPQEIYHDIVNEHLNTYSDMDIKSKYWFFLYKESMLKFWHTECHLVDIFVNDFISFSDLDYIEALTASKYCGIYKGLFETRNYKKLGAHDIYVDLMAINNDKLNYIISDRFYKPMWYKYTPIGHLFIAYGKFKQTHYRKQGNDTFMGNQWHHLFIDAHKGIIDARDSIINLNRHPYNSESDYRKNRFISLKIWLSLMKKEQSIC